MVNFSTYDLYDHVRLGSAKRNQFPSFTFFCLETLSVWVGPKTKTVRFGNVFVNCGPPLRHDSLKVLVSGCCTCFLVISKFTVLLEHGMLLAILHNLCSTTGLRIKPMTTNLCHLLKSFSQFNQQKMFWWTLWNDNRNVNFVHSQTFFFLLGVSWKYFE